MVNVIDNEARKRSNVMPVGIKVIDDKGDVAYTAKTDLGTNYISLESKWFGSSSNNTGGNTGGTAGGNTGDDTGGSSTGGTAGGTAHSQVPQLPSSTNLFSGSAVGNILLSGPTPNYDNVQDGLLITLGNITSKITDIFIGGSYNIPKDVGTFRIDLSSIGLKGIKIPKEKLITNNSFDISDQLSQYVGEMIQLQYYFNAFGNRDWRNVDSKYPFSIVSFGGTTINVLPNTTLSMNLTVSVNGIVKDKFPIPVIQVNTYKN